MTNISEVYACLQPFEQKELMQLILEGAEISERQMMLEIRTGVCVGGGRPQIREIGAKGKIRFEAPSWLPDAPHTTKMGLGLVQVPQMDPGFRTGS